MREMNDERLIKDAPSAPPIRHAKKSRKEKEGGNMSGCGDRRDQTTNWQRRRTVEDPEQLADRVVHVAERDLSRGEEDRDRQRETQNAVREGEPGLTQRRQTHDVGQSNSRAAKHRLIERAR